MNSNEAITQPTEPRAAEFVFREATTPAELEELFRLRYRILRGSNIATLCQESEQEIDFDEFEASSHHFGVYLVDGDSEILVGCERGVFNHETPVAEAARQVAVGLGLGFELIEGIRYTPLQGLQYFPEANTIERFCSEVWDRGGEVVESTRFGIAEEYRSPELSRFIVEATIATYLLAKGIDLGITVVSIHHKPFYYRYGFRQIPGTTDAHVPEAGTAGACLAITRDSIPTVRLPRLQALADQYTRNGCIRFQSILPAPSRVESTVSKAA